MSLLALVCCKALFAPGTVELVGTPHPQRALRPVFVLEDVPHFSLRRWCLLCGAHQGLTGKQNSICEAEGVLLRGALPNGWDGMGEAKHAGRICRPAAGLPPVSRRSSGLALCPCFATPHSGRDRTTCCASSRVQLDNRSPTIVLPPLSSGNNSAYVA